MLLTKRQEEGIKIAKSRYAAGQAYTCIAGYAGTGKSTLVRVLIDAIGLDHDKVAFISYTGKAALVLRNMGCPNSTTAHRLLYKSFPKKDGTFYHIPKLYGELNEYKLIVVDEISMLPNNMWLTLLSHKIPVIALGDPFQLPPIGDDNKVLAHPHIFLDEIMRQDEGSEIIDLTLGIREKKPLALFKGNEIQVIGRNEFESGMLFWADQVICATNKTRNEMNLKMRQIKFSDRQVTHFPFDGDKMICLKNSWSTVNGEKDPLVNGLIGHGYAFRQVYSHSFGEVLMCNFFPESEGEDFESAEKNYYNLVVDKSTILTGVPTETKYGRKLKISLEQFDYGYAITCHKSQGSQWDKVLVFEEVLRSNEHARWLYTAATRAIKKLIIVKKD